MYKTLLSKELIRNNQDQLFETQKSKRKIVINMNIQNGRNGFEKYLEVKIK